MGIIRQIVAFLLATITTIVLSAAFYTQQVLAKQAEIGAIYTTEQQLETYVANLKGLVFGSMPSFGLLLAVALAVGFAVAAVLKRILTPLASVAYPIAGGAAVFVLLYAVENLLLGGGVGAFGGARGAVGMALQALAGTVGGIVFAIALPKRS